MLRLSSVLLVAFVAACGTSSSASSSSSSSSSGGTSEGGADGSPAQSDGGDGGASGPACEGATNDGILGAWANEQMAGGDGPNGIVMVKVTYSFCGSATGGTYRYQEDGLHTPTRDCRRIADLRGTFTLEGTKLLLDLKSGYQSSEGCPGPSSNYRQDVTPGGYTTEYEATVAGDQLTMIQISASGNSSPYVYDRQ